MLKKNITKAFLYCLFILTCTACNNLGDEAAINISDEFLIDMFQVLDQSNFELLLELSTSEKFDCTNYQIGINRYAIDNTIEFILNNIQEPEVCEIGTGPAISEIKVPVNDIDQHLKFFYTNEIFDEALISIKEDKVVLDLKSNNGIKYFINELSPIPPHTITLLFEYDNQNAKSIQHEYLAKLNQIIQANQLPEGYYGYFSVEGGLINAKTSDYRFSEGLHFDISNSSESAIQEFENLLREIQEVLNSEVNIAVFKTF